MSKFVNNQQVPAGGSNPGGVGSMNFLQPTTFKLIINRQNFPNLEYWAQSVNLPALTAVPVELPRRFANLPAPADHFTEAELTANVIIDEQMNNYVELYNWIKSVVTSPHTTEREATASNLSTYNDVTVAVLDSHNNAVRTIKYHDCIPTLLGDVAMEAAQGEPQPILCPISFKFSYFEIS